MRRADHARRHARRHQKARARAQDASGALREALEALRDHRDDPRALQASRRLAHRKGAR